ncbi:hypothetical protein A45J_1508 [hot springs metagenome]|uniref:Uncharacterized protein n=1 Tax=hot springs metagenome TaxID=433727 RepID=A0A5J4L3A7_9ZZZZ
MLNLDTHILIIAATSLVYNVPLIVRDAVIRKSGVVPLAVS